MNQFRNIDEDKAEIQPHDPDYNSEILRVFKVKFYVKEQSCKKECRYQMKDDIDGFRISIFQLSVKENIRNCNHQKHYQQYNSIQFHSLSFKLSIAGF